MKVILVSCSKQKQPGRHPAYLLYNSTWFNLARAYADANRDCAWFILSAKYHLLKPETAIEAYDQTLHQMSQTQRLAWAEKVRDELLGAVAIWNQIEVLAGRLYRDPLVKLLKAAGYEVSEPLAGLGIGQQQQWLKENTK